MLHSDNGSVFRANDQEGKKSGEADFEIEVKKFKIKQIFTRVRYPQGNGKLERLNGTINDCGDSLEAWIKQLNITITNVLIQA